MLATLAGLIALLQPPMPAQTAPQPPPTAGTATVRGRVFGADTNQPMRKAQVRMTAGEIREARSTTTDANGAYEFTDVRPGRYNVTASKGSYVSMSYGQERPTDAPKPIEIHDREIVERLDLTLPRGAVVTGRIVDEFGEPLPEVNVSAQRYQFLQGRRQLVPSGRMAVTNDLGEFRLFGVPPGQYYLSATWRNQSVIGATNGSALERIAFPPTYFPGTTNAAEARRITLTAGQQLDDVVMVMRAVKAARVSGTVVGADGKPMSPAMVMVSEARNFGFIMSAGGGVRPDGTFTVNGLGPGEYTLRAQRMGPPSPEGPETATTTIAVNGEDVSDIHLVAAKPSVASGRIVVDPGAAQQLPPTIMFGLMPAVMNGIPAPPPPPARVAEDFTFELKSPPGRMRVMLGGFGPPPAGWTIRSVKINGTDVTDAGIEFKAGEDIGSVEIELTNKVTAISGIVTDARGDPSQQYTAIVFSQDKDKWGGIGRYQNIGRPDQDGRFKVSGLPAGEYYIVAVDRLEPGQQNDPEFLETIRPGAKMLSLMDGETKTIDLKLTPVQ